MSYSKSLHFKSRILLQTHIFKNHFQSTQSVASINQLIQFNHFQSILNLSLDALDRELASWNNLVSENDT